MNKSIPTQSKCGTKNEQHDIPPLPPKKWKRILIYFEILQKKRDIFATRNCSFFFRMFYPCKGPIWIHWLVMCSKSLPNNRIDRLQRNWHVSKDCPKRSISCWMFMYVHVPDFPHVHFLLPTNIFQKLKQFFKPWTNESRLLTHYQVTHFRLFQTKKVCRRQFQIWRKWQKVIQMGRKHCGKRRNFLLWTISPFLTVFSKGLFPRGVKRCCCVGMG